MESMTSGEHLSEDEYWERYREIRQVRDEFGREAKRVYGPEFSVIDALDPIYRRILDSGISKSEANKFVAWHVICLSTPSQDIVPHIDFEGELSIKKQLEVMTEELRSMESFSASE